MYIHSAQRYRPSFHTWPSSHVLITLCIITVLCPFAVIQARSSRIGTRVYVFTEYYLSLTLLHIVLQAFFPTVSVYSASIVHTESPTL